MKFGRTTDQQIFSDHRVPSDFHGIHAHTSWLPQVYQHLQTNKEVADESAGNNGHTTKIIHVHMDEMVIKSVVESFSNKPNFAIMPIPWREGFAIDDSNLIYEVFVETEKREELAPYLYGQVLGPF